jgi:hypothetical protein
MTTALMFHTDWLPVVNQTGIHQWFSNVFQLYHLVFEVIGALLLKLELLLGW